MDVRRYADPYRFSRSLAEEICGHGAARERSGPPPAPDRGCPPCSAQGAPVLHPRLARAPVHLAAPRGRRFPGTPGPCAPPALGAPRAATSPHLVLLAPVPGRGLQEAGLEAVLPGDLLHVLLGRPLSRVSAAPSDHLLGAQDRPRGRRPGGGGAGGGGFDPGGGRRVAVGAPTPSSPNSSGGLPRRGWTRRSRARRWVARFSRSSAVPRRLDIVPTGTGSLAAESGSERYRRRTRDINVVRSVVPEGDP